MKARILLLITFAVLMTSFCSWSQPAAPAWDAPWNPGAQDCKANPQPPLEVRAFNPQTFIMREGLCSTFEAPFLYLLIGSKKALLIDTGDVADPKLMPLAQTVMNLLPGDGPAKLPLLVVHTHRHLDHRAGDDQFAHLPNVQVVGFDLDSVRHYYNFTDWPNGVAQIDLGDRIVDVIPTPGHNPTHVSFYDRNTGLFFSGDFLMPARLLIDDTSADLASAQRVAAFVKDRPVSYRPGRTYRDGQVGGNVRVGIAIPSQRTRAGDDQGRSAGAAGSHRQFQRLLQPERPVPHDESDAASDRVRRGGDRGTGCAGSADRSLVAAEKTFTKLKRLAVVSCQVVSH